LSVCIAHFIVIATMRLAIAYLMVCWLQPPLVLQLLPIIILVRIFIGFLQLGRFSIAVRLPSN